MTTIKTNIIRLLIFSSLILCSNVLKAQYRWTFDNNYNPLKDTLSNLKLDFTSNWKEPELVSGIKGTGLRTDGYSTWLKGSFPSSLKKPLTITGWYALETHSNDTSGFFFISHNPENWISACVDKYGKPLLGINTNGTLKYYSADISLPKYQWFNVGLSVEKNIAALIVDGKKVLTVRLHKEDFPSGFKQFTIGKDGRDKPILLFPTTALNGIIDEITISTKPYTAHLAKFSIKNPTIPKPDLSVPESRFINDFSRPKYHIIPAANWTNETHGLIYHKGRYHIFNQKNGANLLLNTINWGHFSSPDLVSWTEHRPVLGPEPGFDERGIWSGHAVISDGKPVIVYTGGGQRMNGMGLAFPKDSNLLSWEKYSGNPVIKGPPQQYQRTDLRDPYLWKENDTWYMIIGYGVVENGVEKGSLLLYKSTDLKKWDFVHLLFTGDPENDQSGVFWEMPVFWKMNGKYILLVNKVPYKGKPAVALYWTGNFINEKFVPDHKAPKRLEVVNRLLSPSIALDADGNTTAIAIIPDEIEVEAAYKQGWSHLYSIPRIWTLKNDSVYQKPHPALEKLRENPAVFNNQIISPGKNLALSRSKHQVEIKAEINPGNSKKFGFIVGKNKDGSELTRIYYDFKKQEMIVDDTRSSKRAHIPLNVRSGKFNIDPKQKLEMHVFVDGSVVEVFINNKDAFTTRIFPLNKESTVVELFAEGGNIQLIKASVWNLKSSNNTANFRE